MRLLLYITSFTFILLLSPILGLSQGLGGFVLNQKGEALPYVSISAQPANIGANSNVDGSFFLNLPAGDYVLNFSSIDYKPYTIKVKILSSKVDLKIVLEEQNYQLNEVKIKSGGLDPAVYIMRKAIGAAPYYRRQILKYTAKVYIKGTGSIDYVPKLMKGMVEESTEMKVGKTYLTESINEVSFLQPNTYKEKVVSMQSTMPFKDGPEPMRLVRGSIYNTDYTGIISPLSPQAFSVYNFHLEGSFYENGREVNKIRIEPKRKGADVYTGYLFVVEKLWCLQSCVLNNVSNGVNSTVKISFQQLPSQALVWVPVTYDLSFNGNFLGIKGGFRYLGSVSNYVVTLNPNVSHDWIRVATKESFQSAKEIQVVDLPKSKNQLKIEDLMAKENLGKMEMLQLASRLKRESEKAMLSNQLTYDSTSISIDSLAFKKDSAYWAAARPVPLMASEKVSLMIKDSLILTQKDTLQKKASSANRFNFISYLWNGDSLLFKKNYLSVSSPLKGIRLNSVNGLFINTYLSMGSKDAYKPWRFTQTFHLPIQRNLVQTQSDFLWTFNPAKLGSLQLSAGVILQDFNKNGIRPLEDFFVLLAFRNNYSKWYMNEFIESTFGFEILNGLNLKLRLSYYHRYGIENQTYFKKQEKADGYQPNQLPINEILPNHESYQLGLGFSYRPFQTYRFKQNKKEYLKNKWPVLRFNYQMGLAHTIQFQQIDFHLQQQVNPRHWAEVFYKLQTGYFLNNSFIYQPDKQYFAGNLSPIMQGNYKERFQDLPYYLQVSSQSYFAFHSNIAFKRLLLKRLPYLNLSSFKEAIYFNALQADQQPIFLEFGYRVTELFGFLGFGLNQTFTNGNAGSLSLRFHINF